ncbi:MAG: hypothetical protein ACLQB1_23315 [Streptosporangiaceae bacterium]
MMLEVMSGRDAQMAPGAADLGSRHRASAVGAGDAPSNRIVWFLVGLKIAGNVLRSRRSHELMTVGAIVLVALAYETREKQAQFVARLIAWDRQQIRRLSARSGPGSAGPGDAGSAQRADAKTEWASSEGQ